MPLDKSAIQFEDDYPSLAHISAQAGLPFMSGAGNAGSVRQNADQAPRKADIVVGGKGGGGESGLPYDPDANAGDDNA